MSTDHIITELEQVGTFGRGLRLQPIRGGVLNHSYVLHADVCRYFIKTFDSQHLSSHERRMQFTTQLALADQGLAPRPLYLNKAATFQVDTWVAHVALSESGLCDAAQMQYLATCLFKVHQVSASARRLDLLADWRHYLQMAKLKPDFALLQDIADAERIWHEVGAQHPVLCHNDLSRQHCASEPAHMLFDWEYAALGNRFFDLAACIHVNHLSAEQSVLLQKQYASLSGFGAAYVAEQCRLQNALVQLTNRLWYCAAGEVAQHQNPEHSP